MSDSQVFTLPDLGEGLTEAEIVEWLVEEGSEIAVDQPVVVVETAKATVDVPCPYAGQLVERHAAVGDSVAVGSPLVTVAPQPALAGARQYREEERAGTDPKAGAQEGSGAVLIGYGTSGKSTGTTSGRAARRARLASPVRGEKTSDGGTPAGQDSLVEAEALAPQVISPIVRRLAREHGVDLAGLSARHRHRVLRRADVEAAIAASGAGLDTPSGGPSGGARPTSDGASGAYPTRGRERVPLTGVRRAIADKLSTSRREIPDATTWVDVDATELMAAKDALQRAYPDAGIGVLPLLARICIAALSRFPELNVSVDTRAQEIVRHPHVHLGFAAQSPRGLLVPVVHHAEQMSTRELATALRDLTAGAREGTLSPADLTGGTFTLNNYGVFGVDGSTPILNHPEAAMIGVGRIIERPWVVDHALAVRQVTQIGLTFDHRVCDGGSAGGFLRAVADGVETPVSLLADL